MAKVLGIDYGDRKIGLAIASGRLASPLKVIKYSKVNELFKGLERIIISEKIELVVVGLSEKESARKASEFGNKLSEKLNTPVVFIDETLTSKDAQILSIESGMKRKKRKEMEDAFSATLILQNYLDHL